MFPKVEGRLFSPCLATAKLKSIVSIDMPRSWGCGAAGQTFFTEHDELERYSIHLSAVRP